MDMELPEGAILLSRHPSLPLAIIEQGESIHIFDLVTGKTHSRPGIEFSACWIRGGKEILVLQWTDRQWILVRRSWPGDVELARSSEFTYYSPCDLSAPADGPFAAVLWVDQDEGGIDVVHLENLERIAGAQHSVPGILLVPAFSKDGRLIALFSEFDPPFWCTPDGEESPVRTGTVCVGQLASAVVGEWTYIEAPVRVQVAEGMALEELSWPHRKMYRGPRFKDDRHLELAAPDGHPMIIDVEALRNDPLWEELRAAKKKAKLREQEAESERKAAIATHNARMAQVAQSMKSEGLTCPFCNRLGRDFRYHPGTPEERALFICFACGRSFAA